MNKHTPGPWQWRAGFPSCSLVGSDGTVIIKAESADGTEADDFLIAAAPELLEALQGLVRISNSSCVGSWEAARAAIEKAAGHD